MKRTLLLLLLALVGITACAETATIGLLTLEIPDDFKTEIRCGKDSLGDQEINRWRAEDGRYIELLYFASGPAQVRDPQPMIVAEKEEIEVAGQKTALIKTEVFFGVDQKVLVVHLQFGDSIYIIYSERISKEEFKLWLTTHVILRP